MFCDSSPRCRGLGVSLDSVVWCASGQVVFGVSIDFVVKVFQGAGSLWVFQWTGVKVGCFSRLGGTGSCKPPDKSAQLKIIFLLPNQNICFGYSK